ncbi:ParA family protein [Spirillospora sp. NPDC127200]
MSELHRPTYAPHLPPVLAGLNRAGSVGKTTFGENIAAQAALRGYRVLCVDADNQGDLSFWNGYETYTPDGTTTVHDVMIGQAELADAIVPGRTRINPDDHETPFRSIPGLDLVLGSKAMEQADSELAEDPFGVFWLQNALAEGIKEDEYDLIYIDCPASMGRLSISLILAATNIVVCMKPALKEIRGSAAITDKIDEIRASYGRRHNASAEASYYWINEARKTKFQGQFYLDVQDDAIEAYGDKMLPSLGQVGQIAEAYAAQEPLAIYNPRLPAVEVFNTMLDRFGFPEKH